MFVHSSACPFLVFSVKLAGARSLTYLPSRPIPSLPAVGPGASSSVTASCPMSDE